MAKKWQTVIEARVDVKTTNSYVLHLFCVGFTEKRQQRDLEDLLCPAPSGSPNPQDGRNHDPRAADRLHERGSQ